MKAAILEIKILISILIERSENQEDKAKKYWIKQRLKHARTALTNLEKAIQ